MLNNAVKIESVMIANRGEIACRIIRTVQSLNLRAIAVYSEIDRDATHVSMADAAFAIGPAAASDSYLSIDNIVAAALQSGADAVHPGYGFLSENADFARAVTDAGLVFIGPPAAAIAAMGNKAEAKRLMLDAGVPCVPGYQGAAQSDANLIEAAESIGYPLMIKAAAGGGGRGMRRVSAPAALQAELAVARAEALSAFGSDELILERALIDARHVEVQIFADRHGHCVHLGERDCSVQRRHQKVIEESPCPVMTPPLREQMGAAAVAAARAVQYVGAGTVEFLLDESGQFYFLEMNTRLQVEHPVTEMVTGYDLVALQIAVAGGDALPIAQSDVALRGHAIEVRLYAEDPANDFLPATGNVDLWRPASPSLVRTDAGIDTGQAISPYYDPMLAKLIAHADSREQARAKLLRGLRNTVLLGVASNAEFLQQLLNHRDFIDARVTTSFIADHYPDGVAAPVPTGRELALVAALCLYLEQQAAYSAAPLVSENLLGWSSAPMLPVPLSLGHNGVTYRIGVTCQLQRWLVQLEHQPDPIELAIESVQSHDVSASIDGERIEASFIAAADGAIALACDGAQWLFERADRRGASAGQPRGGQVFAPMPGALVALHVAQGQWVEAGQTLAVLEAMKMQHRIDAPIDGRVAQLPCREGEQLAAGALIADIDDSEAGEAEKT